MFKSERNERGVRLSCIWFGVFDSLVLRWMFRLVGQVILRSLILASWGG